MGAPAPTLPSLTPANVKKVAPPARSNQAKAKAKPANGGSAAATSSAVTGPKQSIVVNRQNKAAQVAVHGLTAELAKTSAPAPPRGKVRCLRVARGARCLPA